MTSPHRRTLLKAGLAGLLGAPLSAVVSQAVTPSASDDPLYPIALEVLRAQSSDPDLPGLISLREWLAGYPRDLSPQDDDLLLGALYLQGQYLANLASGYFTPATIRSGLDAPFAFSARLDSTYFQAVLADALKAGADSVGEAALRKGADQARSLARDLGLPDQPDDPPALFIILVIAFLIGVGAGIWIGHKIWG